MNAKYNPNNYRKIPPFALLSGENFLTHTFTSSLLLVRWWAMKGGERGELSGIIRVVISTPVGDFEPIEYELTINPQRKQYIKFLSIPNDGNEYKLEVIQSDRLKSTLSISEYLPLIPNQFNPMAPTYPLDPSSSIPLPPSANDLAQTAALNTLVANTAALNTAMSPAYITLEKIFNIPTADVPLLINAKSDKTKGVQIINTGNTNIKFWIQDGALANAIYATNNAFDMELRPNAVWEVPPELNKSNIYALAKVNPSAVSMTVVSIP